MIKFIGEPLEIAEEREIELIIDGKVHKIMCTPKMLKELAVGFAISEGFANDVEDLEVEVKDYVVTVRTLNPVKKVRKVETNAKFKIEDLRKSLSLLEIEEYKKTRGYHVAAVIANNDPFIAYDTGRHNAVDKAIGFAALKKVDFKKSYLLLSGRISLGIAMKCFNAGIPLIVSKAAILDSAIEFCMKTGLSAVSFATNIALGNAIE
ncbi:MAG: formate dehydrogenase accessory sulfurtransferase FdhD [Archaeoglobaceae archaeon]